MAKKKKKWFKKAIDQNLPDNLGGWHKDQNVLVRIKHALDSRPINWSKHKKALSAARALQALANVTKDKQTKLIAKQDADYLFDQAKSLNKTFEGGGNIPKNKYFVYRMYEERGHLTASVESIPDGDYVWEYDSENEEMSPVEAGFMSHWNDYEGLEKYLKDTKVIPKDAEIIEVEDAIKRYDYYGNGGKISREEYHKALSDYDKWTGQYEDLEENPNEVKKEELNAKIKEAELKIHRYEREYGKGGIIAWLNKKIF